MNEIDEYNPLEHFRRIFRGWWLLVITALLGGLLAYTFSLRNPPVYEAKASFYVGIDATQMTQTDPLLYQYDEDMAVAVVERALLDPGVLSAAASAAQNEGLNIVPEMLVKNGRIERAHSTWNVSYRSSDPHTAQRVVNLWVEQGYALLQTWRESGQVLSYVVFEAPLPASSPEEPVLLERNGLVLAGALLGFIGGLLLQGIGSSVRPDPARQA